MGHLLNAPGCGSRDRCVLSVSSRLHGESTSASSSASCRLCCAWSIRRSHPGSARASAAEALAPASSLSPPPSPRAPSPPAAAPRAAPPRAPAHQALPSQLVDARLRHFRARRLRLKLRFQRVQLGEEPLLVSWDNGMLLQLGVLDFQLRDLLREIGGQPLRGAAATRTPHPPRSRIDCTPTCRSRYRKRRPMPLGPDTPRPLAGPSGFSRATPWRPWYSRYRSSASSELR